MTQITLRDYLQETEDAISAGRIDDALSHCQNILAQFPESLEVQRLLGEVYLAQERLDVAQQSFDWVLTNDPENVVTYCDRALISERRSDYDTALDCYQQAYELSRGNSDIRKEFNQLSARAGQQGFMFSRAGLARLYMRGDLLTQAIQEWEAVLTVSPERLDARTGLLETCWREGLYDRVEQLAVQILQDVPGCLKAVLLLAYVTSAKNMQQAQELLKRAEGLDPDLLLAQKLFADVMTSQPAEPFLKLLRKPPVVVETSPLPSDVTYVPDMEKAAARLAGTPHPSIPANTAADTLTSWSSPEWANGNNWNSGAHLGEFAPERQPSQDPTALPAWIANANPVDDVPVNDVWSALEKQQEIRPRQEMPDFVSQLGDDVRNANPWSGYEQSEQPQEASWQSLPDPQHDAMADAEQKQAEPASRDSSALYDKNKESGFGRMDAWEGLKENSTPDASGVWASSTKEEAPAPPAWLNMLTHSERRQATGSMPAIRPDEQNRPAPTASEPPVEAITNSQELRKEEPKREPGAEDEESFSFGPEWLKSLGATTMETTFPIESSPTLSPSLTQPEQPKYEPQPAAYEPLQYEPPKQEAYEAWTSEIAEQPIAADQHTLKTLEELELDLRSQGFVPLQPNSLSSIAQTQKPVPPSVPKTPEIAAPMQEAYDPYKEPALLSALAELGNFIQQSSSLVNPSVTSDVSDVPAQSVSQPGAPIEEPSWLASLNSVPASSPSVAPASEQNAQEEDTVYSFSAPAQPFWAELDLLQGSSQQEHPQQEEVPTQQDSNSVQPSRAKTNDSQELPVVESVQEDTVISPVIRSTQLAQSKMNEAQEAFASPASFARSETPSGQLFNSVATPSSPQGVQTSRQTPVAHGEAALDNELETTMKRPAVRLQPMQPQPRPGVQKDPAPPVSGRTRMSERTPSGRTTESNLSYQERLLKGYQHQLVGDYDEAMQAYRIIIRSAPELLADVVSNVRALLKLAPKYSAGYRVLGDAYMRQGEYLQAMEAYNKALTMAKRAKS